MFGNVPHRFSNLYVDHDWDTQAEHDIHRYPTRLSLQSKGIYKEEEMICMRCWLEYVRTGTRPRALNESESGSLTQKVLSRDDESEDEFSSFLIHS